MRRKHMLWVVAAFVLVTSSGVYCYPNFAPASALAPYPIKSKRDDTLRVVMIGDSWAMLHAKLKGDSIMQTMLQQQVAQPVKVWSRGKGGANSKEIYYFMFASETEEHADQADLCTQPLLEEHPDYCLLSAGINDVAQGKGPGYYCHNYELILRFLLHHGIRPVVLEMPTVITVYPLDLTFDDFITERRFYARHKIRDKIVRDLTAFVNGTDRSRVDECREALWQMLTRTGLKDSVLFIGRKTWNPAGYRDKRGLYIDDGTHLNLQGYHVLDSCYAAVIAGDWLKRHPVADSTKNDSVNLKGIITYEKN